MTRSHAGRPSHVPTDETRNMVESLSGFGIPQDEIARLVGIDSPARCLDRTQAWSHHVSVSSGETR